MSSRLPLALLSALLLAATPALADGRLAVAWLQEAQVRSDLASASLTPGVQVTYDQPLLGALGNELLLAASVAGYRAGPQPLHLLGDALLGYRFTLPVGFFLDARVGASYLHVFQGAGTEDAGTLAREGVAAVRSRRLAACGAVGVGWDFDAISPLPFSLFARVTGYDRRVGGSAQLPQLTTQAGLALHFD
jgi:hypothetical protein